jgi:hypothetical protein
LHRFLLTVAMLVLGEGCACEGRPRHERLASLGSAVALQGELATDWADGGVARRLCDAWKLRLGGEAELWMSDGKDVLVNCSGEARPVPAGIRIFFPLVVSCSSLEEFLVSRDLQMLQKEEAKGLRCVWDCRYRPCRKCSAADYVPLIGEICARDLLDGGVSLSLGGWPKGFVLMR